MRIGTDIVEITRISRAIGHGDSGFLARVYTEQEIIKINMADPDYERASGFWAAKEAAVKALGYGFRDGIKFHDIEIIHDEYGCPHFNFTGRMKEMLDEKGLTQSSLSISHCRTHAIAAVVLY